jgi:hypothetical protein
MHASASSPVLTGYTRGAHRGTHECSKYCARSCATTRSGARLWGTRAAGSALQRTGVPTRYRRIPLHLNPFSAGSARWGDNECTAPCVRCVRSLVCAFARVRVRSCARTTTRACVCVCMCVDRSNRLQCVLGSSAWEGVGGSQLLHVNIVCPLNNATAEFCAEQVLTLPLICACSAHPT